MEFKRVLVALDRTDRDQIILESLNEFGTFVQLEKAYFVHIVESMEWPESMKQYDEVLAPVDENIKKSISYDIETIFKSRDNLKYEIIVDQGDPVEELLSLIKTKAVDLLVLGRRSDPKIGYISHEIANMAPCSVAFLANFIPDGAFRVVVPVDFTDESVMALQHVKYMKELGKELEILPVHVFSVPSGYSKAGKSFDEFAAIMHENVQKDFKEFVQRNSLTEMDLSCDFILDKHHDPAQKIFEYSLVKKGDAVVIGSQGRSRLASLIMSSTAKKLVEISYHIPVLILKNKKDNLNFIEALLKL